MPIEVRSLAKWEGAGIPGMLSVIIPSSVFGFSRPPLLIR
jgi:hypothetical protein